MTCATNIEDPRNADLRISYTFPITTSIAGFSARMQVRESEGAVDPALLTVEMNPTANGSVFEVIGQTLRLTITKEDLLTLPEANPVSDPISFVYDIILTDLTGFENYFLGGSFTMLEGVTRG